MFTRKETLLKKTGPDGIGRYEFLKQLIVEFGTTTSTEAKRQVLANLANFAYDPINFEFLKQLHAIDLFLDQLTCDNEDLLHFGLCGLCNISPDPESKDYIIKLNVGDKVSVSRIIKKEDVEKFTELSGDTNPIHSTCGQERAIVHGAFLNALVSRVIGTKLPGPGAMVISQTLNFPNKCYVDEEVKILVELMNNRKILTVKFVCEVPDRHKIVLFGRLMTEMFFVIAVVLTLCSIASAGEASNSIKSDNKPVPCTCGVFLSGQFKKGSKDQPKGVPVLTQEMETPYMNNAMGNRQCTNKCLEMVRERSARSLSGFIGIITHLPKSADIICATVDRDLVHKERAFLFFKNYSDKWQGTNLSAGREFCCKDNVPYKCPLS
ncbi:follicle cell protein 3C-1 [Asbolus verrucosus]|uniref:Follicle cell protein 3C-1 n=1 Tax=Asbolus verrucosus TaxID=1661398 RepID=A0A482VG50_ASBVE|nr:follicle cell protein 3C-1 [Asbolus verrucosus]